MNALTEKNFDQETAQGVVVIDFSAEWCPPCRILTPIFQRVAEGLVGKATFATVDADGNSAILQRFGVQALPTVLILRDGRPVRSIRGLRDEKTLAADVRDVLDAAAPVA